MVRLCGVLFCGVFMYFVFQRCLVWLGVAFLLISPHICSALVGISTCSSTQTFPQHGALLLSLAPMVPVSLECMYLEAFHMSTCQRPKPASVLFQCDLTIPVDQLNQFPTSLWQLCHPTQPWLPEPATYVTMCLNLHYRGSHLPALEFLIELYSEIECAALKHPCHMPMLITVNKSLSFCLTLGPW